MKERFEKSDLHRELVVDPLRETMGPATSKTPGSEGDIRRGMGFNLTQFKVLTQRYLEIKFKDTAQTLLLLVQAPVVALLVALMASGAEPGANPLYGRFLFPLVRMLECRSRDR